MSLLKLRITHERSAFETGLATDSRRREESESSKPGVVAAQVAKDDDALESRPATELDSGKENAAVACGQCKAYASVEMSMAQVDVIVQGHTYEVAVLVEASIVPSSGAKEAGIVEIRMAEER